MNPIEHHSVDKATEDVKIDKPTDELMVQLLSMKTTSDLWRDRLEYQAARSMRLVKGLPVEDQSTVSNVRKRRKLYFRKIWSSGYRILASMFQAFLQDMNQFRLEGRDEDKDPTYARVLQKLVEYYRDSLMRRRSLFVQFLWNFLDVIFLGQCYGKLYWRYNEETGDDHLDYKAYPLDQIICDWSAVLPSEMSYYGFENYLNKNQLEEEYGEEIAKKCVPTSVHVSPLRSIRYYKTPDPLMKISDNPETTYPEAGTGTQPPHDQSLNLYSVIELFYRKRGKKFMVVINPEGKVYLKDPQVSPYGKIDTLICGSMLLEAHKAVGEGMAEPMEGPQESLNYNINVRKDNVDMALRVRPVYDRDANIDLAALLDHRTGLPIGVDGNVNDAVKFDRPPDVTQSSYVEGSQDINIMDEYAGTNPTKQGNTNVDKTGVAQINLSEGSAKIDLFIATVGETFFRQWYYTATELVAKFCTDEKAMRIANEALRRDDPKAHTGPNIYDLEDLDVDVITEVGAGTVSRQVRVQQLNQFIGQSIQANNVTALMLKSGIQVPGGVTLLNITKMLLDMAPELGIRNVKDYEIPVGPPPAEPGQPGSGGQDQKAAGANAPQPNSNNDNSLPAANGGLDDVLQRVLGHSMMNSALPKGER
jgi:hypothetical protein